MKITAKIAAAAVLLFGICAGSAFASPLENKNAVGIYGMGGINCGGTFGIQYERRVAPFLGLKFDTYVLYNPENAYFNNCNLVYNINTEADFRLYEVMWDEYFGSRLYAYVRAGHTGYAIPEYQNGTDTKDAVYHANAVLSAGFGLDIMMIDHISIPVSIGYMAEFPYSAKAGFCAGVGIRYSW